MKKLFAIFIILLTPMAFGKNILSPEYSYKQMKEYIKGSASFSELEKQIDVDNIVSDELGIDFIYTNLSECLKYALEDNYDIKMNEALNRQKLWNYRNSITKILPNIYYDYTRQDLKGEFLVGGIVPVGVHEIATNLYLHVEWDWFKKGKYFFDALQNKYLSKSAKANKQFSIDETILKTTTAYYNLLLAKLEIEEYRTNIFELKYYKQIADARYKAGLDKKYDVKRAEADLAQAQKIYETGKNALRLKQAELAAFMGLEVLCPIYPYETEMIPRDILEKDFSVDELYYIAEETREDIKSLKAQIQSDIIKKNSNYTDIIPDFSVSYQDGFAGTKRTGLRGNTSLMFRASMTLGKNMIAGTMTQIKADDEYVKSQRMKLRKKEQEIKTAILKSYLAKDDAIKSLEASKKEFEAAQESLNLAIGSYKEGQCAFSEVLDAQTIKSKAKLDIVRSIADYNKAQIQLLFESGMISYSKVLKNY